MRGGAAAWLREAERLDVAAYAAIARAETPRLDRAMSRLSSAADYSRLSLGAAAVMAASGGVEGRRAAASGLRSLAVTAAVVNLAIKPLARRPRPDRAGHGVPAARHVAMPVSRSFPSGHSAAAFAFATGVARVSPRSGAPLFGLAGLVAYSLVHTGVHFPADAIVGSALGIAIGRAVPSAPLSRP